MRGSVFGLPNAKIKSIQLISMTSIAGSVTAGISSVDMSKTIVIPYWTDNQSQYAMNSTSIELTSSTVVTLYSGYAAQSVKAVVIEFSSGVVVQRGSVGISSTYLANVTVSDSPIDKSLIIATGYTTNTSTSYSYSDANTYGTLTTTTNLRVRRGGTTDSTPVLTCHWQILTHL